MKQHEVNMQCNNSVAPQFFVWVRFMFDTDVPHCDILDSDMILDKVLQQLRWRINWHKTCHISILGQASLTLSQCTLAGPVYTGMPLVDPVYTGIPLEKLSWNSPTLECLWRNLVESAPHWDATGETLTFVAYTGTPLEGLWQPTHAPTHIVKHAE